MESYIIITIVKNNDASVRFLPLSTIPPWITNMVMNHRKDAKTDEYLFSLSHTKDFLEEPKEDSILVKDGMIVYFI